MRGPLIGQGEQGRTELEPITDRPHEFPFATLPDLLGPGLRVVFVGINPSRYAVARGHYFARPANRFWPAFSGSRLSLPAREALGRDLLTAEDDEILPRFGFGFTDVVKRPTAMAAEVRPAEYRAWTPRLVERLNRYAPRFACFHGMTGFRPFARHGLGVDPASAALGLQPWRLGATTIFVMPNPSPANARYRVADLIAWYDRLADLLDAQSAQAE